MKGLRKKPSADRYVPKRMEDNIRNQYSMWYKKQEKKEEQEVQNTLTLKSVAKFCIIKYQQFQEYE